MLIGLPIAILYFLARKITYDVYAMKIAVYAGR
jgi:hypothetical protein